MALTTASRSLQHVIRAQRAINNEMAHQLYVLQVLTFNLLEDRMMTKMDPQDQVSTWCELVRTGRGWLLVAVPKAGYGGKDAARDADSTHSFPLCEAGLCFLALRRSTGYCILSVKVQQNGQPFLLSPEFHELCLVSPWAKTQQKSSICFFWALLRSNWDIWSFLKVLL